MTVDSTERGPGVSDLDRAGDLSKAGDLSRAGAGVPMLEVRGIVKTFGPLTANDHVSLSIGEGEIHALLGENGAGKPTLVKMLYGSLQPDSGEIRWRGQPVTIAS